MDPLWSCHSARLSNGHAEECIWYVSCIKGYTYVGFHDVVQINKRLLDAVISCPPRHLRKEQRHVRQWPPVHLSISPWLSCSATQCYSVSHSVFSVGHAEEGLRYGRSVLASGYPRYPGPGGSGPFTKYTKVPIVSGTGLDDNAIYRDRLHGQ